MGTRAADYSARYRRRPNRHGKYWYNGFMKTMKNKPPQKSRPSLSGKIIQTLVVYAKTQLILMLIVGVVAWMALVLIGVQFPLLLAIMTGALSVIPVLGMTVAAIIVSAVAVFDAIRFLPEMSVLFEGLAVAVVYGIMNFVIDNFLSPYLVGNSSGIHPVMLLVFVVIGTFAFGIWGAFFTVPVILVLKTITGHYIK